MLKQESMFCLYTPTPYIRVKGQVVLLVFQMQKMVQIMIQFH